MSGSKAHTKQPFGHRLFGTRSIVLDPRATLDTLEWLLFATGIRAVDHAVESYCSPLANPATEPLSLQGLTLLARALPKIKSAPDDREARLDAQFSMWQAAAAGAAGVSMGASHGIGYVLGASYGVPHGHTSCVMLPAVLRWNAVTNGERQRALSQAMGDPRRTAADLVKELVRRLDLPTSLPEVNVKREELDDIAQPRRLQRASRWFNARSAAHSPERMAALA